MKTANACIKKQGLLCAALLCLTLAAAVSAQVSGNTRYCEITLTGCPPQYDNKELVVPLEVIALATHVQACGIQDSSLNMGTPPAVMFIIDHSTSMDQNDNNDGNGNRFRVTRALIDSIYAVYPAAEVGIAIFANGLVFNADRDSNLVVFGGTKNSRAPAGNDQSYMPLLQLNRPAKMGGSNPFYTGTNPAPNAIDVYRNMFTVPPSVNQKATITGGPNTISGTDISIAFEAALEAFARTDKPRENQYIIFLSDGAPGLRGNTATGEGCPDTLGTPSVNNPRCALLNNFSTETNNVPTTYTVFLQRQNPATPPIIATMTANIRNNGYSSNNPHSEAWALTSNYSALLSLMMDNIVTPMLSRSEGHPNNIVVSSPGVRDSTGSIVDGEFVFSRRLPVDTSAITAVNMRLRYDVQKDTITADGRDTSYIIRDSLFSYNFGIRRTASPPANWETSQGLRSNCARAPTLDLKYDGVSLTGPGGMVKGTMDVLQIVFDNTNGLFIYDSVIVTVQNQLNGEASDTERFKLVRGADGKWTYQFPREVKDQDAARSGDGKLQNTGLGDSIVLIFRNPNVPLDTIRVAVPYVSNLMAFYDTPGDPSFGARLPDTVSIRAGELLDIYAKIFNDGAWTPNMAADADSIVWILTGPTNETLVYDEDVMHRAFRSTTAGGTYVVTASYWKGGSAILIAKVIIKVNPGDPVNTAGPNPFVPGTSKVMDHLRGLTSLANSDVPAIYESIVSGSASGGGPRMGGSDNVSGILVAATGPKPIKSSGRGTAGGQGVEYAMASAIIYDAVGHIVFRSKKEDIVLAADGNTFGFVWNGKNSAGRTVGPGTYLLRMNATMANNEKYSYQRMIGVTVSK
ncbi:MAG: hypothetical protein LBC59_02520 [Chitinispirillales bacterium]|jgi:hypothetical protein|nr:hypothetical protein [Chitinispirillales bacterium]